MANSYKMNCPDVKKLREMIQQGLISEETECQFEHLFEGRWLYKFVVGDRTYDIYGGDYYDFDSCNPRLFRTMKLGFLMAEMPGYRD